MKFVKIILLLFALTGAFATNADVPIGATISCTNATDIQFVPNWGQVKVNQDPYSKYIYQWMYWDSYARLAWLNSNSDSTFEPDAFFDGSGSGYPEPYHQTNVPPTMQGNSSTAYGYLPRNVSYAYNGDFAGYWNSDLPNPYQDTAWSDGGNEWAVTVGSAQASLLSPQRLYYTVTRMFDGGASSGEVKLSSQRGRRASPTTPTSANPYGKWNSYGCSSGVNNVKTISWYTFKAPGCRTYWYKWDISTNQAC